MDDQDAQDAQEPCPLCPPSGPPEPPSKSSFDPAAPLDESTAGDAADDSISWIECSKCRTWYHGVCIIVSGDENKSTIPQPVLAYVMDQERAEWTNWTGWVGRWFCRGCIAHSVDPTNAHRPHHALVATIDNRTFPPKPKQPRKLAKRGSTISDRDSSPAEGSVKRRKLDEGEKSKLSTEAVLPGSELPAKADTPDTADGDKANGSARPKRQVAMNRPDYHALHHHIATPTARWLDLIKDPEKYGAVIKPANIPRIIPSKLMTRCWLDGLEPSEYPPTLYYGPEREPLVFRPEDGGFEGLGGKIPGPDLTVADVARLVGPNRLVDVIDVATQQSEQWTLEKWAGYVASKFGSNTASASASNPDPTTSKVFNVISLEISGSKLAEQVVPPTLVSEIDWVDNCWNFGPGGKAAAMKEEYAKQNTQEAAEAKAVNGSGAVANGTNGTSGANGTPGKKEPRVKAREPWPKVQLYCLMGAKGSWTDWHVDFAASSVYYTIHTGAKTFFIIRPTEKNLAAYADWSGSYEKQQTVWLGDMCDEVRKVELKQGDTMMLPAGYIHSVYTPEDSIVFGGNFLHSYDIPTQLRLRQIEIDTKVPQRFRFPFFDRLCWYVAERYTTHLRQMRSYRPRATHAPPPSLPDRVMQGMLALSDFLIGQCDLMDDPETEEKRRKLIYDRIPDLVKDAPALARELKWRVERELPAKQTERVEVKVEVNDGVTAKKEKEKAVPVKPKRSTSVIPVKGSSRIWNTNLPSWEESIHPVEQSTTIIPLPKPKQTGQAVHSGQSEQKDQPAEERRTIRKQSRKRVRELQDGTTVLEEQETVFTERVVLWSPVSYAPAPMIELGGSDVKPMGDGGVLVLGKNGEGGNESACVD